MSNVIFKTEDAARGLKRYEVLIDDTRTMAFKTSPTATQADIDALVEAELKNEAEVAALLEQEEKDAAYAKEHGDV